MRGTLTLLKERFPRFIICVPLIQQPRDKLAARVPGGKVGEVLFDLLGRELELRLDQALAFQLWTLQLINHVPPVSPGVEVTLISQEHLGGQAQLILPNLSRYWDRQSLNHLLQNP